MSKIKETSPNKILEEAAETFLEKNKDYKDNWKQVGHIFKNLFPGGIDLKEVADFNRMQFLLMIIGKLTRYCNMIETPHKDSIRDLIVYAAMLESSDENEFNTFNEIKDTGVPESIAPSDLRKFYKENLK